MAGGGFCDLGVYFIPAGSVRDGGGAELEWATGQPVQGEDDSAADSREEVVLEAFGGGTAGRVVAVREHLHRDVLCVHVVLAVQGGWRLEGAGGRVGSVCWLSRVHGALG